MMEKNYSICPFPELEFTVPKKCYAIASEKLGLLFVDPNDNLEWYLQVFLTKKEADQQLEQLKKEDKQEYKKHTVKKISWKNVIKLCRNFASTSDVKPAIAVCAWENDAIKVLTTIYVD